MQDQPLEWRPVVGLEGFFEVSNYGDVRSVERVVTRECKDGIPRPWVLKPRIISPANLLGYKAYRLQRNGERFNLQGHRIVAQAFIPNPNNYPFINHLFGDRQDNRAWMLEWCTPKMNQQHSWAVLGRKAAKGMLGKKGELCKNSKPVFQMNENGEIIQRFHSITEAELATGVSITSIIRSIKTNKPAKGYVWKRA